MGLVCFGHLYGLWPHIVVFGVDLRFIVRDVTVEECHDQHHAADPHYHSVIAVLIIFVALIRLLIYDTPFFPQISNQLLLVPLCFGEEHRSGKGTLMVGFLLVGVILKTLCIFIRIIEGFMLQSADKFLKAICQMGNFIVIFLIHMDYRRLSLGTASSVVQENHIVSGAWTVADGHADGRILPLIDHKLAAQLSTEGAALFSSDAENAGDGHMVICPAGRFIAGIAGVHRNAAVVLLHQPNVGGGQLVAQFLLHAGNQLIGRRITDIFFQCIPIIIPEVGEVEALKWGITGHEFGLLLPAALAFPNLRLTLPNYCRGIFILRVQLCPPLSVGNGLFLLAVEILIAIGHPHIPLRLVLAFLPDGLQHLNGPQKGFVSLGFQSTFVMVPDDGVVLQCTGQGVGGAVVPPVLRDGIQCLDTAGVLVFVVPLLQLLEEGFGVLLGVRNIVHARQRFVQLVILILSFCPIILLL